MTARYVAIAALLALSAPATARATIAECGFADCISDNSCSFAACAPAPTTTVYYVCDCQTGTNATTVWGYSPATGCTVGNDTTNNGTSPSTPFRTWEKGRSMFAGLPAGGQLLYCRGGVFTAGSSDSFVNTHSTSSNHVVVGSYYAPWGNGTERRAAVNVPSGQYGINTTEGSGTTEEGYDFFGIAVFGSGTQTTSGTLAGAFVYNITNYVTFCDMEFAGNSLGVQAGGGTGANKDHDILVRNSYLHDLEGQGVLMGDDNYTTTYSCFVNNGFGRAQLNHHGYYGGNTDAPTGGSNMLFSHNSLYRNALINAGTCSGYPCAGATCSGAEFVAHGRINGLTIEYNFIREDNGIATGTCYGLGLDPGYTSPDTTDNGVVRYNIITRVGQNPINVAACHNCSIYGNLILQDNGQNDVGIAATNDGVNTGEGDYTNQDITITGNDVVTDQGQGVGIVAAISRGISTNNAVVMTASSGTVYCFKYDQSTGSYTKINNNLCYASGAATLRWNVSTSDTFATWKSSTSFDLSSINATNPLFTNLRVGTYVQMQSDYIPQSGSPMRGAGDNPSKYLTDYAGRTPGNPPDVGAWQFVSAVTLTAGKGAASFFGGF